MHEWDRKLDMNVNVREGPERCAWGTLILKVFSRSNYWLPLTTTFSVGQAISQRNGRHYFHFYQTGSKQKNCFVQIVSTIPFLSGDNKMVAM